MVKKYWAELLTFGAILAVMLIDLAPDITWMNTDSDGAHYILAAKYFTTAHNMSAPLYLLLGHLFLELPFGTEAWRMGLMSAIPTVFASIFIYLIVREKTEQRIYGIISALIYGGSALVISQSTIVETYSLATMCGVGAYYFCLKGYWTRASLILGFGMPIHPFLTFIAWLVLFFSHKEMRNWRRFMITIAFFSFYLYIPIVGAMGRGEMWGNTSAEGFFAGLAGMVAMLSGGLSMWDMPKRIVDIVGLMAVSLGVGLIPLLYHFYKERKWKYGLLWLFLIPIGYFATNLAAETYVYMIVAVAYGSILAGIGLSQMNRKWVAPILIGVIALGAFNANYFDIGRTLDPEMSAVKFYKEELPKIPEGEIFMGGGWNWAMVFLYNKEHDTHIVPVSTDMVVSKEYRAILDGMGIKYKAPPDSDSFITYAGKMALSIAEHNEGVWIAKETKPEVYQYVIEPARGNEDYIGHWIGQEISPQWKWKPSNPYHYITGSLEIPEWHHILMSNINANTVISLAIFSWAIYWYALRLWEKRRVSFQKTEEESIS